MRGHTRTLGFPLCLYPFDFVPLPIQPDVPLTLPVSVSSTISFSIHPHVPISVPLALSVSVTFAFGSSVVPVWVATSAARPSTNSEPNGRRMRRHCEGAQALAPWTCGCVYNRPAHFASLRVARGGTWEASTLIWEPATAHDDVAILIAVPVSFALSFAIPITFPVSVPVAVSVTAAETGDSVATCALYACAVLGELLFDFVELLVVLLADFAVLCL